MQLPDCPKTWPGSLWVCGNGLGACVVGRIPLRAGCERGGLRGPPSLSLACWGVPPALAKSYLCPLLACLVQTSFERAFAVKRADPVLRDPVKICQQKQSPLPCRIFYRPPPPSLGIPGLGFVYSRQLGSLVLTCVRLCVGVRFPGCIQLDL